MAFYPISSAGSDWFWMDATLRLSHPSNTWCNHCRLYEASTASTPAQCPASIKKERSISSDYIALSQCWSQFRSGRHFYCLAIPSCSCFPLHFLLYLTLCHFLGPITHSLHRHPCLAQRSFRRVLCLDWKTMRRPSPRYHHSLCQHLGNLTGQRSLGTSSNIQPSPLLCHLLWIGHGRHVFHNGTNGQTGSAIIFFKPLFSRIHGVSSMPRSRRSAWTSHLCVTIQVKQCRLE